MEQIRIILSGAAGKMGRVITRAIIDASDMELVGAVDLVKVGEDAGVLSGDKELGVKVTENLEQLLDSSGAAVMIDFTSPLTVMENIHHALKRRVAVVVGTTGLDDADLQSVQKWVDEYETGAIIAPNYSLGAVLMMKMACMCGQYINAVEIIELHHDHKMDAPSGTALKTAQLISESSAGVLPAREELEKIPGARGGRASGIPVHSIRLPGLVAHQEVIFGDEGQLLTLRHDAINRNCFIPGVLMAIRHINGNRNFIYGMENLI